MIWIGRAHGFCQEASPSVPQSVWGKLLWIEIMEIAPRATWGLRWKERIVGVHNTNTGVHKSLVYTDTSAHKHRCKHRCTQWGLEWLWKQENVSRSWGVTVRCPCTLYIVHTVQPILFKYLPSVRQNTTTSRIKDVHWLLLHHTIIWWYVYVVCLPFFRTLYQTLGGEGLIDKSLTSLYGRTGKIKTPEHLNIESNWLRMWYRVLD